MSEAPIVYRNTVDALLERMLVRGNRLTPHLEKKLAAIGIRRGESADVPQASWRQALPMVAGELFGSDVPEDAHRRLGTLMLTSFADTLVGKALFTTLRVIGVRRGLERMTKNFRIRSANTVGVT